VIVRIDCGAPFDAYLTPGARDSLKIEAGKKVWLVIKTYSCHLLRPSADAAET
jgi:ABC-type molybdate transport system ATPase subunit